MQIGQELKMNGHEVRCTCQTKPADETKFISQKWCNRWGFDQWCFSPVFPSKNAWPLFTRVHETYFSNSDFFTYCASNLPKAGRNLNYLVKHYHNVCMTLYFLNEVSLYHGRHWFHNKRIRSADDHKFPTAKNPINMQHKSNTKIRSS